jgi:hypothetical protein
VNLFSYDSVDLSGIVIENPLVAEHMRVIFNVMKEYFKKQA